MRLGAAAAGATCAAMLFALAGMWTATPAPMPALTTTQAPKSLLDTLRPRAEASTRPTPAPPVASAEIDRPQATVAGDPITWGLPRQPMTVRALTPILDQPSGQVAIGHVRPGQRLRVVGEVATASGDIFVVVRLNDGALGYAPAKAAVALGAYRGELAAARKAAEAAAAPVEFAPPAPVEF
jgi:hypothetical protein